MISAAARRFYTIASVVAVGVLMLVLSLVGPILSTSTDFSIYNSGWNGTSELATEIYRFGNFAPTLTISATDSDMAVVHLDIPSLDLLPGRTSLIIIGPSLEFTEEDGRIAGEFVRNGGKLLLADDFGTGNTLLTAMNATSRFSGELLMDLAFEKQPEFSVCFDIDGASNQTQDVRTLLFNFPSSISTGSNATVLARSSIASFLDIDGNHLRNWSEPRGPFPVLAIEKLGQGEILLLSDPSIIINGMLDQADNGVLADNLMYWASQGVERVYFDESHRDYFDPVSISLSILGQMSDALKLGLVVLVLLLLLTMMTEYPRRFALLSWKGFRSLWGRIVSAVSRRKTVSEEKVSLSQEELISEVMKRHPDWRPGRLRMLLEQAEHHGKTKGW